MLINEQAIKRILGQRLPPQDDPPVTEYLVQVLIDADAYQDCEALVETLLPFFTCEEGEGECKKLARELVEALVAEQAKNGDEKEVIRAAPLQTVQRQPQQMPMEPISESSSSSGEEEDEVVVTKNQSKNKKPKREGRRQPKREQAGKAKDQASCIPENNETVEDDASAWKECQELGMVWGGRGKGGRGEYSGAVNSIKSNVHLSNVSVSLENGMELLANSTMDIVKGHRYGLIGRNGVGKSTLLRRLAQKAIPGMPQMKTLLVQQQVEGSDESSLDALVRADVDRTMLLREQEEAEGRLESDDRYTNDEELEVIAKRLGDIAAELDAISADTAEDRAVEILEGLQFTDSMIHGPTKNLSGGWRMRLALAQALFVPSDLLLFDECTNHMDLYGLAWLIKYLNEEERTLIVVSHDRSFLDAVCTDIVVLDHQKLKYHVGNYSEYDRQQQEKAARESQILDAADRQRAKAQEFIQKQQAAGSKKSADPKKQRQAKMMREKKLDRIGNYREDGKRYKLNSLKKLSEDYIRLAQKVTIEVDAPVIKMYFPNPSWPPGIAPNDAIVRLEDFDFSFDSNRPLLKNITLSVNRGSKVALVGKNGAGKTSLMKVIAGDIDPKQYHSRGRLWIHPNLRVGHVTQYAVEELECFADQTVADYAEERLRSGKATSEIVAKASGNIRQYLGAFGLGGRHALQKIGKLSGGERMRLCFATILAEQPHLLILDESTNHVDIETLDSMSDALNAFEGSILMVSHNQGFLSGFCKELWVIEDGNVVVNHSDTETFDEIFSEYRSSVLSSGTSLTTRRQEKASMAKRATRQRSGARQNTALL